MPNESHNPDENPADEYFWRAVYADGELDEYGPGGPYGWKDIDQDRLQRLILVPQVEGLPHHVLSLPNGSRPIFFRRGHILLNPESGEELGHVRLNVIGFQRTEGGTNVQALSVVYPDGSVLMTDDPESF